MQLDVILHSLFDSEVFKFLIFVKFSALAALLLIDLSNDGIANALQFLHLLLIIIFVGFVVLVKPVFGIGKSIGNGALIVLVQLVGQPWERQQQLLEY